MLTQEPILVTADAVDEAKTYLRLDGSEENATLALLIAAAAGECEAFVGAVLIRREFTATLDPSADWRALGTGPVQSITAVEALADDNSASALIASAYALEINSDGAGRVRFLAPVGTRRARVRFTAGLASGWSGVGEGLRRGIVRLVAHRHVHRDDADALGFPAAVAAMWRPYRALRLA